MYSSICNSDHQMPVIMKEGFADSKGNGKCVKVSCANAETVFYNQHLYGFCSSWKWEKLSKFTLLQAMYVSLSLLPHQHVQSFVISVLAILTGIR